MKHATPALTIEPFQLLSFVIAIIQSDVDSLRTVVNKKQQVRKSTIESKHPGGEEKQKYSHIDREINNKSNIRTHTLTLTEMEMCCTQIRVQTRSFIEDTITHSQRFQSQEKNRRTRTEQ